MSYSFPLSSPTTLTLTPAQDVWSNFEDVRQPVAFEADVRGSPTLAAYWIPLPDADGFIVKWRDETSAARHIVLQVNVESEGYEASASIPGSHVGLVLKPFLIEVRRC